MLHPIPESSQRQRLLQVVEMQHHLITALCARPAGAALDVAWLRAVWPAITDVDWLRKFWDVKVRDWCAEIVAAAPEEKQTIMTLLAEQLRFAELYRGPPSVRLTVHSWTSKAMVAVKSLLKHFYDPLFYARRGYPNGDGTWFHKTRFLDGLDPRPKVCPYTDMSVQDTKIDHFLPKDDFPMLSCHPENLIPCSTDANLGGRKGTEMPLDPDAPDQAANWFHPRLRSAAGTFRLAFPDTDAVRPRVRFDALAPADQPRLDRMEAMFGLSELWSRDLDDELQLIAAEVRDTLAEDTIAPTETAIRTTLQRAAYRKRRRIGHDSLAIVTASFYEHILATPSLFAQIVRTCTHGT